MKPYYDQDGITIYHGDCLEVMATFCANRFDTVITDPPYELGFMGKKWDSSGVAFRPETWAAVLRVCKPGTILLAFGGTRTFHRLTCAIEDGGWEIRDCMMWLYGSGFPKSLDISKAIDKAAGAVRAVVGDNPNRRNAHRKGGAAFDKTVGREPLAEMRVTAPATDDARLWSGWGTALKPAWEPIIVAMKPLDGTFAENAHRWGVAGMNIDGGRINSGERPQILGTPKNGNFAGVFREGSSCSGTTTQGRWPANVLLDEEAAAMLDEQTGELDVCGGPKSTHGTGGLYGTKHIGAPGVVYSDAGGASRFFYTAKASKSDRGHHNNHPTVKPTDLMKYLCKLTATPTGGEILDPFGGSMTTLVAAQEYGRPAVAIELDEAHCAIGVKRIQQGVLFAGEVA